MTGWMARARAALKSFCYSGPFRDRWQHPDRVLAVLGVERGQRVADVGAGGGYFTFRLAETVGSEGRVYAVDADPEMLDRIARRTAQQGHGNVVTVQAGAGGPELPEPTDLALVVDAFHHLPDARVAYFSALAECLAPGGRVAVIEPRPRWFLFGHATEPERIRAVLGEAGFEATAEHGFLPRQSFTVFQRA